MNMFKTIAAALALSATGIGIAVPAFSETVASEASVAQAQTGTFVKKSKKLRGGWEVVQREGKTFIVFGDDFRAAKGPDLKIFLSPKSIADATGKNAGEGALNLGELKKTKGMQEYEVPEGVNLDDFSSVLVHCEAYAVLWGGSDL